VCAINADGNIAPTEVFTEFVMRALDNEMVVGTERLTAVTDLEVSSLIDCD